MNRPKAAVAVLLLLVGGGVGYLLMPGDDDPGPASAFDLAEGELATADPTPSLETLEREEAAEPATPLPIDTEAFPGEAQLPPTVGLSVLVRDAEARPAPGAMLRMLDPWAPDDTPQSALVGHEAWERLSDADGVAGIDALPATGFRLCARRGEHLGFIWVDPQTLDLPCQRTIDLRPVRRVEITVVDREGTPLPDVRVTIGGGGPRWTASDGVARFEVNMLDPAWTAIEVRARAHLGTGSVSSEPVPWSERGVTRMRLEVDRGVTLEVTVLGEGGRPHPGAKTLRWRGAAKTGSAGAVTRGQAGLRFSKLRNRVRAGSRRFSGGVVRVAGFAAGATLDVCVEEDGCCPTGETVWLPDAETLHAVRLGRGEPAPSLEVPVIDATGVPLTQGSFEVLVTYDQKIDPMLLSRLKMSGRRDHVVPDARGVLICHVVRDHSGRVRVRRAASEGGDDRSRGRRAWWPRSARDRDAAACQAFPALGPGASWRLDAVEMPAPEVLVSGRVLDARGEPVAGAFVHVLESVPRGPERRAKLVLRKHGGRTRSAADGTFVIPTRDDQPLSPGAQLCAQGDTDLVSELVPFAPGDSGIDLRLLRTGALEGSVHGPFPHTRPWVRLQPRSGGGVAAGGEVNPLIELATHSGVDGSFRLRGLPPGIYDAGVELLGFTLLNVRGIVIRADAVTRDPRLDGLRVGDQLGEAIVRVRDGEGGPIPGARVTFAIKPQRGERPWIDDDVSDAEGRVSTILPHDSRIDVGVRARGFRHWQGTSVCFPLEVILDPGCRLEIVIENARELVSEESGGNRYFCISAQKMGQQRSASPFHTGDSPSRILKPRTGRVDFADRDPGIWIVTLESHGVTRDEGGCLVSGPPSVSVDLGELTIRAGEREIVRRFRLTSEQLARIREE